MIPDLPYKPILTDTGRFKIIISDYAPLRSYMVDSDKNQIIITEDNMRKLIWKLNSNDFDKALKEVCNFVLERLYFKIERAFSLMRIP